MPNRKSITAPVSEWRDGIEFGYMGDFLQIVDIRTDAAPNQTYGGGARIIADSQRDGGPTSGVELRVGDLYPAPNQGDWLRLERGGDLDADDDLTVWFQTYSDEEPLPVIGNRTTVNPVIEDSRLLPRVYTATKSNFPVDGTERKVVQALPQSPTVLRSFRALIGGGSGDPASITADISLILIDDGIVTPLSSVTGVTITKYSSTAGSGYPIPKLDLNFPPEGNQAFELNLIFDSADITTEREIDIALYYDAQLPLVTL